jgi:pyruvate ferredoxin oxidoreductase beta subunit
MNNVRRALSIGGPTFIHCLNPCPKGWDFDPKIGFELGELSVSTGIFPLYEIEEGKVKFYGKSKNIADGTFKRRPVRDYLLKQGRFAHFIDDDIDYFQSKIDEMWDKWLVPGIIPLQKDLETE